MEIQVLVWNNNMDILGLAEANINWKNIPFMHRLQEHTMTWWESGRIATANNHHDRNKSRHHWGGVAIFSINKISH